MSSIILFLISILAGVLTVLAPCTISLLPVIVGGTLSGGTSFKRSLVVTVSLGVSVILFTLLLKVSLFFVNIPQSTWHIVSGVIIISLGIVTLFPSLLDKIKFLNKINKDSNKLIGIGYQKQNFIGDVLTGIALGPVFSSCSPTYFLIIATVLPKSLAAGMIYLLAYTFGLCATLLLVTLAGQKLLGKFGVLSDPKGWLKKTVGVVFLLLGVVIFTGYDTALELSVAKHIFDVTSIEQKLLQTTTDTGTTTIQSAVPTFNSTDTKASIEKDAAKRIMLKSAMYPKAPEITKADGYINTDGKPITISEFKGKKVVLIDFWTYSCINCQRTEPFMKAWYDKYHDQGLEIISIHTPEFAFEHVLANVAEAVKADGIKYPVVLDNEYGTWNAFANQYWPRKYLIDTDGFIIYDHAGEGDYDLTEQAIQKALAERSAILGATSTIANATVAIAPTLVDANSPETYFGSNRNSYLGNGTPGMSGIRTFDYPTLFALNTLYFSGTWTINPEYAQSNIDVVTMPAKIKYKYNAKGIYFVAGADTAIEAEVTLDGKPISTSIAGADISYKDGKSYVSIQENRLYKLIDSAGAETHTIEISVPKAGLQAFTFTFG